MSIPAWPSPGRRGKAGKTVIRGGFGIYHEDGQLDDQNLPAKNEVPSYSVKAASSTLCTSHVSGRLRYFTGPGTLSPNAEQRNRKDSYVEQWSLSVQRELPANFVGTVSYLGSHGVHLLETNVVNLIDPATETVQYPAFAPAIPWRGSVGMSTYNGLSVALRRSFSHGLLVTANYTVVARDRQRLQRQRRWRRNIAAESVVPGLRYAPAAPGTPRHVVNGNAVYQLALRPGQADAEPRRDCKRYRRQLGTDHDRPRSHRLPGECADAQQLHRAGWGLRHGASRSGSGRFSHSARGQEPSRSGSIPRRLLPRLENSAPRRATSSAGRAPGRSISVSARRFSLPERGRLEFRSEFYNIFNHPQLGPPQSTFNPSNTTGFGSIITTVNLNTAIVNPITPWVPALARDSILPATGFLMLPSEGRAFGRITSNAGRG